MANSKSGFGPIEQAHGLLRDLMLAARNLSYASVGIVGAIGEEAEEVYRRSIIRGKGRVGKLEQRLPLPQRLKRAPQSLDTVDSAEIAVINVASEAGDLSQAGAAEWRAVLNRLNLANPQDLELLSCKIAELEAKLDELSKGA
jgi:hypothetical protein